MSDYVIEFDHIFKKFARGEQHNSLRDFIPSMAKKLWPFKKQISEEERALREQEFWAVKDVSFKLKRGESMGIIGPNGSGKSTTLKLLSGILRPDRGTYNVKGRLSALIEVGAGFHPDLTGRENVFLNGSILGMTRKEVSAKFNQIVEFAGVEEFIDTPVKRYSSGMAVRLGFAVSAFIDPDVLLVDEVLAVGDAEFRTRCHARMTKMLHNGATMILVSHNLGEVRSLCTTSLLLYKGETQLIGDTSKVLNEYFRVVGGRIKADQEKTAAAERVEKGSLPIQLLDAQTLNDQLTPSENFQTGDAQTLRIQYDAKQRLERPQILATLVWAAEDYVASVCSSKQSKIELGPIEGRGYIDLKIDSLICEPNLYGWTLALIDGSSGQTLDRLPKVRFMVTENLPCPGVFMLSHRWEQPVSQQPDHQLPQSGKTRDQAA